MILCSTHRKIAEKDGVLYELTFPAWTMKAGTFDHVTQDKPMPGSREIFASRAGAQKQWREWSSINESIGGPIGRITVVKARSLDYLTQQPIIQVPA